MYYKDAEPPPHYDSLPGQICMFEESRQEVSPARRCAQIRHLLRMADCRHHHDDLVMLLLHEERSRRGNLAAAEYCRACGRLLRVG